MFLKIAIVPAGTPNGLLQKEDGRRMYNLPGNYLGLVWVCAKIIILIISLTRRMFFSNIRFFNGISLHNNLKNRPLKDRYFLFIHPRYHSYGVVFTFVVFMLPLVGSAGIGIIS
jgi:hypothetical protein